VLTGEFSDPICIVSTIMLVKADNGSVDHLDGAIMIFGEGLHDQVPDAVRQRTNRL